VGHFPQNDSCDWGGPAEVLGRPDFRRRRGDEDPRGNRRFPFIPSLEPRQIFALPFETNEPRLPQPPSLVSCHERDSRRAPFSLLAPDLNPFKSMPSILLWIEIGTMKTLGFLVVSFLASAYAEDVKPSKLNTDLLCQHWMHAREEQQGDGVQVYRASNFKKFPPSRFRMPFVFAKDGTCKWMFLSPEDAHHFKDGKWKTDPADHQRGDGGILRGDRVNERSAEAQASAISQPFLLIDSESVCDLTLASISEKYHVLLFVEKSPNRIPFPIVNEAQRFRARLEWMKIAGGGKNHLDFCLPLRLGQLSKDKGFDAVLKHAAAHGHRCSRIESLGRLGDAPSPVSRSRNLQRRLNPS
jgi:hypothetical protein